MNDSTSATVTNLEPAQNALRLHFLGWQCRLRQRAVRQAEGRPSAGMCPQLTLPDSPEPLAQIVTLIHKSEPEAATAQLQHLYRKTFDPAARRDGALKFFAEAYYQRAREFSDQLTALFGPGSALAERLLAAGRCRLDFDQYNQRYRLPCSVVQLAEQDAAYQATFWHNSLFNAQMPGGVRVLAFQPDWAHAEAEPGPAV